MRIGEPDRRAPRRVRGRAVPGGAGCAPLAPPPVRGRPAEEILAPDELELYERLRGEPDPEPGGQAVLTVIMKATRLCNLRCTYCHSWRSGPNQKMTFDVLAHSIHGALRDPSVGRSDFVWHGGEATVLPSVLPQALWLAGALPAARQDVLNTVQANAPPDRRLARVSARATTSGSA
jgi:hypothetical protein